MQRIWPISEIPGRALAFPPRRESGRAAQYATQARQMALTPPRTLIEKCWAHSKVEGSILPRNRQLKLARYALSGATSPAVTAGPEQNLL